MFDGDSSVHFNIDVRVVNRLEPNNVVSSLIVEKGQPKKVEDQVDVDVCEKL